MRCKFSAGGKCMFGRKMVLCQGVLSDKDYCPLWNTRGVMING